MALETTSGVLTPVEFLDIAAQQLLLQPDYEYIWARNLYSAAMGVAAAEGALADVMSFSAKDNRPLAVNSDAANMLAAMGYGEGGPLMLSLGASYPELVKFLAEAKNPGDNIMIDRPVYIDGDTTFANRVASNSTKLFGTNSQGIRMDQVAVAIKETLGPTDASGNLSPISIPSFQMNRAKHPLALNAGIQLKRDRYRMMNAKFQGDVLAAAAGAGNVTYQDEAFAAKTDYTGTGAEPFTLRLIRRMSEALTSRKIPGVAGTRRFILYIDNHQYTQLKNDPEYQRLSVFTEAYNILFPGYIRDVDDAIICIDVTMPTTTVGASSNITGYQCVMMGAGAYGWASAMPATLLRDRADDGGRENRFGWHAYEGFGVLDARFFQVAYTD